MKRRAPQQLEDLDGQPAYLYVRESTKAQGKKYGPYAQRERATRFAAAYGLRIVATYQDLLSGRSAARRDDFQRMLTDIAAAEVHVVIVAYASRWARDEFDGFATLKQVHDAAGCLVVADKALLSTDEARFTELSREIVEAAHYSRELSRNIRDGIAEKIRIRRDAWSHPLLGFRRGGEHRTLRPDKRTMPTAVRAFELAAQGKPDQAIADELGVTLWRIRGALRSPLYAGRLPDGRPTTFRAPVDPSLWERAQEQRRRRAASGHHPRQRVYPLSDRGPLVCDACGRPLKGRARYRRSGTFRYYRHDEACEHWPSAEIRAELLEDQVAQLLAQSKPNAESARQITAALSSAPEIPDRLGLARIDRRLRECGLELVDPDRDRSTAEILAEIEALQQERARVASQPVRHDAVPIDEALDWLNDLGKLWTSTSDAARRQLASTLFTRLGALEVARPRLHDRRNPAEARIVSVEASEYAERRGLVLALPARLAVTVVGDTGVEPTPVTSWPILVARRRAWQAAARSSRRSA